MPHSWSIERWPAHVHPGTATRARYLVRAHRDELLSVGALARVGRELVILGEPYSAWLGKNTGRVPDYRAASSKRDPAERAA
jgi:hypothetical protein